MRWRRSNRRATARDSPASPGRGASARRAFARRSAAPRGGRPGSALRSRSRVRRCPRQDEPRPVRVPRTGPRDPRPGPRRTRPDRASPSLRRRGRPARRPPRGRRRRDCERSLDPFSLACEQLPGVFLIHSDTLSGLGGRRRMSYGVSGTAASGVAARKLKLSSRYRWTASASWWS